MPWENVFIDIEGVVLKTGWGPREESPETAAYKVQVEKLNSIKQSQIKFLERYEKNQEWKVDKFKSACFYIVIPPWIGLISSDPKS